VELAARTVARVYTSREFVDAGGLMVIWSETSLICFGARDLCGQDSQGCKPATYPSSTNQVRAGDQPEDCEGVGLTIPPSVLSHADDLIQ
jgi:hypothetical protein